MGLTVTTQQRDRAVRVGVDGDIDIATRDELDSGLFGAIASTGTGLVEVDLTGVLFIDSSGIAVLLKNRRRAEEAGVRFRVVAASDLAERILRVCGVWRLLNEGLE
ncbi:MAG TPA: STAS domain-containing protein [Candidatus Limnocylindrales bacterium]